MRLLSRSTLRDFWAAGHGDAERPLRAWAAEVEQSEWTSPAEIKVNYSTASFIGRDRVVFNIGGNKYRLIVKVKYAGPAKQRKGAVFVRFIGTHKSYDNVAAGKV